jgi:hypothetical protein
MSVPTPVNGNGNFVKVLNRAGQIEQLDASDAQLTSVTSETVTSQTYRDVLNVPGRGTLQSVVGYAPTGFGTTAAGAGVFLNVKEGLAPATTINDVQLLTLPTGAVILNVQGTNNNTTLAGTGATFTVGVEAFAATPSDASLFTTASLDDVNNPGGVIAGSGLDHVGAAGAGLGGAGVTRPGVHVHAGSANVGVLVNNAALTAGDFAVRVEYLL